MKPRYIVKICLLTEAGRLLYFTEKIDRLDFNKKIGATSYKIRKEGLYEFTPWLYKQVYYRAMRIREYWILFNENEPDPVLPNNPEVSPYELYIINNSTAMQRGISDYMRSNPLGNKGGFILLIAVLAITYVVAKYLGVGI